MAGVANPIIYLGARSVAGTCPRVFWCPGADLLERVDVGTHVKLRALEVDESGAKAFWDSRSVWIDVDARQGDRIVGTVIETFAASALCQVGTRVETDIDKVFDVGVRDGSTGMPILNEARARFMVGKRVLIGLTFISLDGLGSCDRQLVGVLRRVEPCQLVVEGSDGVLYSLPPTVHPFEEAPPGEYRLRSTGETVVDPDYLSNWIVTMERQPRRWSTGSPHVCHD